MSCGQLCGRQWGAPVVVRRINSPKPRAGRDAGVLARRNETVQILIDRQKPKKTFEGKENEVR